MGSIFARNDHIAEFRVSSLPSGDSRASRHSVLSTLCTSILDTLPDAICVCAIPSGTIIHANRRAVELWGRTPTETDLHSLLPLAVVFDTREPVSHREAAIDRTDGTRIAVTFDATPMRETNGEVVGVSVVFRERLHARECDVQPSDLKQAAEENARLLAEVSRLNDEGREAAERYRQLADNLPAGFIYQIHQAPDGTGGFTYVSAGVESLLGVKPADVVANPQRLYGLIHPEDLVRLREAEIAAMQAQSAFHCRFRTHAANGEIRWLHCRSAPRPMPDGGNVWDGIAVDITERVRAEEALRESEERLRLALDAGQCGVWDWDILANRVTWSERIYAFHGLTYEAFGGRLEDCFKLMHPDDTERVGEAIRRALEEHAPYSEEFRIVRPTGEVRWINNHGRVLFDDTGRAVRMLGATTDVTERRAAEESLRDTGRRKDEFIAMLAHELRNPLAPIRNSLHILQLNEGDWKVVERVRGMMERQVLQLTRLVDDLLDVSRITLGKVQLQHERLDLARLVRYVAADQGEAFAGKGVTLRLEAPSGVWISGDSTRLAQVVGNLLTNALKFTPRGGEVVVSVSGSRADRRAIVSVKDTGAGIEPTMLARLFEPFTQADHTLDRSQGGLGLGLAIVKGLVELHRGTVRAESAGLGQGATFTFALPADLEAPALLNRSLPPARSSQPLRILVVEDNRDAADSLRMLLEVLGYEVEVAYTGTDGVRLAEVIRPHVVLCDIGLPGMDGFAVASALRGNPKMADARLIALTGYGQEEDRKRTRAAGFDEHLTKPADPVALCAMLAQKA